MQEHENSGTKNNDPDRIFQKYKTLQEDTCLPFKVKIFYSLLEDAYSQRVSSSLYKSQAKTYKLLLSAFKKQSQQQKARFLLENLKLFRNLTNKDNETSSTSVQSLDLIKEIETSCKVKQTFLGITRWEKKSFKLSIRNYKIKLTDNWNSR